MIRKKIYWMFAVVVAVILAAIILVRQNSIANDKRNNEVTQQLNQQRRSICVGRFVIDLPADASIEFRPAKVAGVDLRVFPNHTNASFLEKVAEREKLLRQEKNEYDKPSLEKKVEVDGVNIKATVFYYNRTKPVQQIVSGKPVLGTQEGISSEAFAFHNGKLFHFNAEDLSSPRFENNVLDLVKKFEARGNDAIPEESGFCTEAGVLHDPIPADDSESVAMFASIKGHPDIAIRLVTLVNGKAVHPSVLDRVSSQHDTALFPNNIKRLREARRMVNGIEGDEIGTRYKEGNGAIAHFFMWVSVGKPLDVTAPKLTLELESGVGLPGEKINSSLSDEAVLKLWDALISSVRFRPISSAPQTSSSAAERLVPLGELGGTGGICPQTGHWDCSEGDKVAGGRSNFLRKGDQFTHAILLGTQSFRQKLIGDIPLHRVSTVSTVFQPFLERARSRQTFFLLCAFATLQPVCAMPAEPEYKDFTGRYMIYSGGLGDPSPQTRRDAKIALTIRGSAALHMFDAMGPDVKDDCTAGTGMRVRRKDKENLVCVRTPEGTYTCSFGFDLKSGRSIGGSMC